MVKGKKETLGQGSKFSFKKVKILYVSYISNKLGKKETEVDLDIRGNVPRTRREKR